MSRTNISSPAKKLTVFKIISIYLVVAGLWIILSDKLLALLTKNSATLTMLQTIKGWFFVMITAWLFYGMIKRYTIELKRTDEIMQKERDFTAVVADTIDALILVLDNTGRIVRFNRACEKATGYSFEEVKDRYVWDFLLTPEEIGPVKGVFHNLKAGMFPNSFENFWVAKDGRRLLISWSNNVLLDRDGKVEYVVPTGIDITEQKKLQSQLIKAKEDWEASFNTINDAITIHDADFNIIRANKAASELLGLPFLQITRQKCFESYHGTGCPPEGCPSCQTLKTGKASVTEIYELHLKKYIEIKALPRFNENNRLIGLIHVVRDITEHKKLEEQYRHAQKMEAIGALAGGIAHDFNNVLNVIIGFGDIMQMSMKKDDPLKDSLDEILAAADRARHLTQSLLAFSRKQIMEPRQVNLNEIVKGVKKMLTRIIGEDIELGTVLADEELTIMADYSQIEQVLMNLATNARAAMPEGGKLLLETGVSELNENFVTTHGFGLSGKYAILSVTDTGSGMDEKTREKVFEPFFTTKGIGEGTGLGLSIVYGIIKQHNGYVNVFSEPGIGTTFKLYLPITESVVEETKMITPTPVQGGTETILIAEDYETVRNLTSGMLRQFGYTVVESVDGEDAVQQFTRYPDKIHLLLLDVIMPKKNGRNAYEEIRRIKSDIKVLFMSGYTADLIDKQGILGEGLNFIPKPVSMNDLLRKIREVLDK